jgi:amino acid transporter
MAFHNTAARYLYSLGREGVVPGFLGTTHDTHKSPHMASLVQSVLAALWIILYAVFNGTNDPNAQAYLGVYTLFAVLGTGLLLVLQAIVSIAIILYFQKHGGGNMFSTMIAPIISFVAQAWLVYLLVSNLASFAGTSAFANTIPWLMLAILVVGLIWGFILKGANPEAYRNIGHMVNDG